MKKTRTPLRAIDLYSGAGGWSLGLRLAQVEIVCSYDWWGPGNETNFKNNHHQAQTVDIRRLDLVDLPKDIDIVVGSPPCTQFSFANRGGNGDIEDGLKDISKFLSIIDHLRPRHWVMENVPRVAGILSSELRPGGKLARFRHLGIQMTVVNMADYGVPQRRMRCIAGNIDFDLLSSYASTTTKTTLGKVIRALGRKNLIDPIYGISVPRQHLTDHIEEDFLSDEEVRINRALKCLHPVYNAMAFPDPLTRTVRTITATCTRVSRESVVIECIREQGRYRRLTIREKACLQGFPADYQFYSTSYSHKARQVGNAVPPPFAYLIAQAIKRVPANLLPSLKDASQNWRCPATLAIDCLPSRPSFTYPSARNFRFAIPSLRLKSGVRFELANATLDGRTSWAVAFYFGTSTAIHKLDMTESVFQRLSKEIPLPIRALVLSRLEGLTSYVLGADLGNMQKIWSHTGVGRTRPFMLLDELDEAGRLIVSLLEPYGPAAQRWVGETILSQFGAMAANLPGLVKLARNAPLIFAGLLIGSSVNTALESHPSNAIFSNPNRKLRRAN